MPSAGCTKDRTISGFLKYFESIGSGDAFRRMCILDALILNTDRHSGNFGVLYQNDTMQVQKMAPVFDNNRSLLFDLDDGQLQNTEWCEVSALNSIRASRHRRNGWTV